MAPLDAADTVVRERVHRSPKPTERGSGCIQSLRQRQPHCARRLRMSTGKADGRPGSIISALDAPMPGAAIFRCKPSAPPWEPTPATTAAEPPRSAPESYLSKQSLAAHYAMSVRWIELRIAEGLPVADYMDKRPRFRLSETDSWLRERGHLSAERPDTPRPGTKAGAA